VNKIDIGRVKGKKILAIGAHPDDVDFSCGGTLLLLSKQNRIVLACVTSGQMGTHDEDSDKTDLMTVREREQREAGARYKASQVLFLQFPDFFVSEQPKRLRKRLIKLLVRVRPDIVITHDPWSEYFPYHPDHRVVGFAVYDALLASTLPLYLQKKSVAGVALSPRPELWLMHPHEPSHAVDITSVYPKKIAAIKLHKSQFDGVFVWEKVEKRLVKIFSGVGKEIGARQAEAFRIISPEGDAVFSTERKSKRA